MLTALCSALLGGVILNFMPCVFPVLSLKAAGLVRHAGGAPQARRESMAFFLGVMLTLLLLAGALVAARAGGAAIGWGFQLQSPVVIAVLALVMLAAALNLAGLFEVGLSVQGVGQKLADRGGLPGAAFTGALAIIVATPCSAPFMAGALGYALVQPPLASLAIFAALGVGFAAPLTLLGFSPALIRRLPRPGPWMALTRQMLAFPMFGAAAWLAWVLSRQAGQGGLALILAAFVALGFAAWIYGIAQRRRLAGRSSTALHALSGAALAAIVLAVATLGRPVRALDGPGAADNTVAAASARPAAVTPVTWSPGQVQALRAQGRPILLNFTAAWCITCQVNDKAALSTQAVGQALARTGTTYMVADSTNYDPRIQQALAAFGREGLPLYVVYPADGRAPVILPQILTPALVVNALEAARKKTAGWPGAQDHHEPGPS